MKKALYTWAVIVAIVLISLFVLSATSGTAHAEEDDRPVCPVVEPITNTVYVDRIINVDHTVYVDKVQTFYKTLPPVEKTIVVEKPVYEVNPETLDPKVIRAMMKVTHDRYLALLTKYRALKPRNR